MRRSTVLSRNRLIGLLGLGVAVVAIVILSAGLSDVDLLPGEAFFIESKLDAEAGFAPLPPGHIMIILLRAIVSLALLLLPVVVVLAILSPEFRKRMLRRLLSFLVLAATIYLLVRTWPDLLGGEEGATFSGAPALGEPLPGMPSVQFNPDPPAWLVLAASLGLALLLSALLVGAVWFLRHRTQRPEGPLEQLAHQAEEALELLRAGSNLKDIVMHCYAEMSRTLDRERGIVRQGSMTPREFESRLAEAGLPGEPVRRLTRLFEQVRYGAKVADAQEEEQALACLAAVVAACRGASTR
jgi:hypothetical protein